MAYLLTLLYVGLSLLSPAIFPPDVAALHLVEILAVCVVFAAIPSFSGARLGSTPEAVILLGLVTFSAFSMMATGWVGGVPITMAAVVPPVFSFYLVVISCRSTQRLRMLVYVMLAVALFIFVQGVIAVHDGGGNSPWYITEGTVIRTTGMGFLNDPNDLAQFYVTLIPLLYLRWKKGSFFPNLMLSILPSMVLLVGVYDTQSRGGLIAAVGLTLFAFKEKVGKTLSIVFGGLLGLGITALNLTGSRGLNEDDGGRVELWSEGLTIFRAHPLLGVGVNNFGGYSSNGLTAHNTYVLSLAELGLLGFFWWMGMLVFNWFGLAALIPRKKPVLDDGQFALPLLADPIAQASIAAPEPAPAMAMSGSLAFGVPAGSYAAPLHLGGGSSPEGPQNFGNAPDEEITDATFAGYARTIQTAFVGFLISAFFISRTYVMILYILLGISVAMRNLYRDRHPEFHMDTRLLTKRTVYFMFGTILFLYVFIRVKGTS